MVSAIGRRARALSDVPLSDVPSTVTTTPGVIASHGLIWQAGEHILDGAHRGAEYKLDVSADAGGTSQTLPSCTVIGMRDGQDLCRRRSWKLSRHSPVTKLRALSAISCRWRTAVSRKPSAAHRLMLSRWPARCLPTRVG